MEVHRHVFYTPYIQTTLTYRYKMLTSQMSNPVQLLHFPSLQPAAPCKIV